MKELFPLKGIVTVLNTPFDEDDTINLAALRRNVTEVLNAGGGGFLVPTVKPFRPFVRTEGAMFM